MKRKSVLMNLKVFVACTFLFSASSVSAVENIYLENFRAISNVINENFYKPINFQECADGKTIHAIALCNNEACFEEHIKDAFKRCLDKNSRYVPSQEVERDKQDLGGSFGGVGLELFQDKKTGEIIVIGIIPDGPADGSGIQEGDVIIWVDGKKIQKGMKINDVITWIRGTVGEEVRIYIRRNGIDKKEPFLFKRQNVVIKTVSEDPLPDSAIVNVRVSEFTPGTAAALLKTMKSAEAQGKKGMILDFRNDPGGLLDEAVCVVALFAADKEYTVATLHYRNAKRYFKTGNCEWLPNEFYEQSRPSLSVVLLVNEMSASASEIVAANLQEFGLVIVGSRTYKKGTVQTSFSRWSGIPLGKVWLTVAEYRTGEHDRVVDGVGVQPDVEVTNPKKENVKQDQPIFRSKRRLDFKNDLQLKKALEILQKEIAK